MNLIDQTIDSRKVTEMIQTRHDNLLQKINLYIKFMNKDAALKNKVGEYFIESEYFDINNQLRKCFIEQEVKSLSKGMSDESVDRWYQVEVYNTERQLEDAILEIA